MIKRKLKFQIYKNCLELTQLENNNRILIVGGSESGKKNSLFNLIHHQPDIEKIYLYAKGLYEAKYQFLIDEREHFNDSKAFIEYSIGIDDIYKDFEEYNPNKKHKIFIVFDDLIADILSITKLKPIVTELFVKGRKLNISLAFITKSYFAVPKNVTKFYALYYYENSKQTGTSTN